MSDSTRQVGLTCCAMAILSLIRGAMGQTATDWPNVFNDKGGTRFSSLEQITRENVTKLSVAWRYKTGDSRAGSHDRVYAAGD